MNGDDPNGIKHAIVINRRKLLKLYLKETTTV
jgi:hypothetical protein